MATIQSNGVSYTYAPNPKMYSDDWEKDYPPIQTNSRWLINKFTGEILPNTPEFARRSDILEVYLGELPEDGMAVDSAVGKVNAVIGIDKEPSSFADSELAAL